MAPRSVIWKFFTRLSTEQSQCNICSRRLKTSGNTTNLKNHLKQRHILIYKEQFECDSTQEPSEKKMKNIQSSPSAQDPKEKHNVVKSPSSTSVSVCSESTGSTITNWDEEAEASCSTTPTAIPYHEENSSDTRRAARQTTVHLNSRQPSINLAMKTVSSFSDGGSKYTKITDAVVNFIVQDNLPFTTVEGRGFLQLMKEVVPLYKVPTRNCIKDNIDKKYDVISDLFKNKLQNIKFYTLTTDVWTTDLQTKSFLGVTIHFIEDLQMCSATLGVVELSESHTSAYIANQLENMLIYWNIDESRIVASVTDNGTNMVKACQDFLGKSRHVPCFAHTVNLVCEYSIKNTEHLPEVIDKVRKIVVWLKRNVHACDELRKAQKDKGTPEGGILKPILDVKTRWNSTYYMLERFLKLAPIIGNIVLSNVNAPNMLNAAELEDVKQICNLLFPLEQTTKEMSGQNYITLSKVIPMVKCLITQYESFNTSSDISQKLITSVLKELDKRFGSVEKCFLLAASTILDPRFKNIHFKDAVALSNILRHLRNEISSLEEANGSSSSSSESSIVMVASEKIFDLWAPHKNIAHTKKTKKSGEKADELTQYLSTPVRSLKENPLQIWDEMKLLYPNLYKLAQKYLGVVATSVPSERLFSKAGQIANKNRNRLTGKRLSKLLFLESYISKSYF